MLLVVLLVFAFVLALPGAIYFLARGGYSLVYRRADVEFRIGPATEGTAQEPPKRLKLFLPTE